MPRRSLSRCPRRRDDTRRWSARRTRTGSVRRAPVERKPLPRFLTRKAYCIPYSVGAFAMGQERVELSLSTSREIGGRTGQTSCGLPPLPSWTVDTSRLGHAGAQDEFDRWECRVLMCSQLYRLSSNPIVLPVELWPSNAFFLSFFDQATVADRCLFNDLLHRTMSSLPMEHVANKRVCDPISWTGGGSELADALAGLERSCLYISAAESKSSANPLQREWSRSRE